MKTPSSVDRETLALLSSTDDDDAKVNWQDDLSPDLWMLVLSYVAPLEILGSVLGVSKSLHSLINTKHYWLSHLERLRQSPPSRQEPWLQLNAPSAPPKEVEDEKVYPRDFITNHLNQHQLQRLCLYWVAHRHHHSMPNGLQHGSRLVSRLGAEHVRQTPIRTTTNEVQRRRVCVATSTEHSTELLENVLQGRGASRTAEEIFHNLGILAAAFPQHRPFPWWSSRPSPTQEGEETLLFCTNCPLAVLSSLKLRPLLDPYTRGQVYSWQSAVIKAYRLPLDKLDAQPENNPKAGFPCSLVVQTQTLPLDDDDDTRHAARETAALQRLLQDQIPVYTSSALHYSNSNNINNPTHQRQVPWQRFVFPPTTIANVVTITLMGKNHKQFPHSGYYACVEQVQLEGIPLLENASQKAYARTSAQLPPPLDTESS